MPETEEFRMFQQFQEEFSIFEGCELRGTQVNLENKTTFIKS